MINSVRSTLRNGALAVGTAITLCGAPLTLATPLVGNGYANGSESFLLTATPSPIFNPVGAGGFVGTFDGNALFFWCAQLTQSFSFGPTYDYQESVLNNLKLSQLFTEVGGAAGANVTTDSAVAFQLAIWEILFETTTTNPYNVGTGNFLAQGSATTEAIANAWLAGLTASSPANYVILALTNPDSQDFVTGTLVPRITLPEPSSLPLFATGLLAVAFVMRRRGNVVRR